MAEITVPYLQRQLARQGISGSGTGRSGGIGPGLPSLRVPDVSGVYGQLGNVGEDLNQAADAMAQLSAQRQRARDTATITALEASVEEQVSRRAEELKRDASIHPFDYRPTLETYRNQLLESAEIPGRLRALAKAKVQASTGSILSRIDAEGTKRGVEQMTQTYDLYMDQQSRDFLNAETPQERDAIAERMRTKTIEYTQSGIFSQPDAAQRLRDWRDKTEFSALEMYALEHPRDFLDQANKGALNNLPGEMRVKLIDKAQIERREAAEWQDSEDRRAEKRLEDEQEMFASELREQVYQMGGGQGALKRIAQALDNRQIGAKQHDNLMGFAIRLQESRASQAAAAATRAAAQAQRAEMAQRRADENTVGMMEARLLANKPGPDGQLLSTDSILEMAASGKINGNVAGEVARRTEAYRQRLENEVTAEQRAQFDDVLKASEAMFEQSTGGNLSREETRQAWATYQERLRSAVFRDKQNPYDVMDKIINQHLGAASGALESRVDVILKSLPPEYRPTKGEGIEAQKAQLNNDFRMGVIREGEYRTMGRQLKELEQYPGFNVKPKPTGQAQAKPPEQPGLLRRALDYINPPSEEARPPHQPEGTP